MRNVHEVLEQALLPPDELPKSPVTAVGGELTGATAEVRDDMPAEDGFLTSSRFPKPTRWPNGAMEFSSTSKL